LKPTFDRTGEQELDQPLIAPAFRSFQKIHALLHAADLKLLAWLNAVSAPDYGGQDNLSLAAHDSLHDGQDTV